MKIKILILTLLSIFFIGCEKSSYKYTEIFHNEYYYKLLEDPNYKLKVENLDLDYDIKQDNMFCYSEANSDIERVKVVINYLRSLPIECNDKEALVGPSDCVLDSSSNDDESAKATLLDLAAKEHSNDMAYNNFLKDIGSGTKTDITAQAFDLQRGSTPKERAEYNGYDGKYIKEFVLKQNLTKESIPKLIEKAMKSKSGFCSFVLDKSALHLGVDYKDNSNKERYWTIILGDDRN